MAEIVRMPKLSDTMTEGVVASWLKQVGDEVENGSSWFRVSNFGETPDHDQIIMI